MKHLYFVLTARCNEKCKICPRMNIDRISDIDTYTVLARLKDTIQRNNITDITISGGEPSLHSGFGDVLRFLDQMNIETVVLSNSIRFQNQQFTKDTFGSITHKDHFRLVSAIHSLKSEIHDNLTGVQGSMEKTVQGLTNVRALGISVEVKCVIGCHNRTELPNYPEWVSRTIGKDSFLLFCGMDYAGMDRSLINCYKSNLLDIRPYLEQALEHGVIWLQTGHVKVGELPLCVLDPYYWGTVNKPFKSQGIYNDSHWKKETESVPDIWPMTEECRRCKVKPFCNGIWSAQYKEYRESTVRAFI